jgi:hypothetical protein
LFFGGIVATVMFSDMSSKSVVITTSQKAGNWKLNPNSPSYLLGGRAAMDEDRQRRVWAYKNACYGSNPIDPTCHKFYSRKIPSQFEDNIPCPFDGGKICLRGSFGAYRRTTGVLDSSILGINAPASKRFHFRKTMECAPLRTDDPYVEAEGEPEYPNEYLYNYGPVKIGDFFDYYTYHNPMEWKIGIDDITPYTLS